jgi:hypothetical protein
VAGCGRLFLAKPSGHITRKKHSESTRPYPAKRAHLRVRLPPAPVAALQDHMTGVWCWGVQS